LPIGAKGARVGGKRELLYVLMILIALGEVMYLIGAV
jgi:hypothetical protein